LLANMLRTLCAFPATLTLDASLCHIDCSAAPHVRMGSHICRQSAWMRVDAILCHINCECSKPITNQAILCKIGSTRNAWLYNLHLLLRKSSQESRIISTVLHLTHTRRCSNCMLHAHRHAQGPVLEKGVQPSVPPEHVTVLPSKHWMI